MNEIASRPKNRNRASANDAIVPMTIAIAVAASAALTDNQNASRASESFHATLNQWNVNPGIGQLWIFEELKA
jgi:hypothetical protein